MLSVNLVDVPLIFPIDLPDYLLADLSVKRSVNRA